MRTAAPSGSSTPPSLDPDTGFAGGGITQEPLGELSCRGLVRDPGTGHLYVHRHPHHERHARIRRRALRRLGRARPELRSRGRRARSGSGSFSLARALVRQPDGKVIVVGTAGSGIGSIPKAALVVRFDTNGQLDSTFGPAGIGLTVFGDPSATFAFNATAVVLQDDGRILVGGTVVGPSNVKDGAGPGAFVLTRFTADGQYDVAFGEDPSGTLVFTPFGTGVSAALHTMALQPDGKLLVAGEAGTSQTGFALARYIVSGASVTPSNSTTTTLPGGGGGARVGEHDHDDASRQGCRVRRRDEPGAAPLPLRRRYRGALLRGAARSGERRKQRPARLRAGRPSARRPGKEEAHEPRPRKDAAQAGERDVAQSPEPQEDRGELPYGRRDDPGEGTQPDRRAPRRLALTVPRDSLPDEAVQRSYECPFR